MLASLLLLQTALVIAVGGSPATTEYLPLRVAQAEGRFIESGASVTLRHAKGEVSAAEALANGEADFAATTLESAIRHGASSGKPPRLLFALTAAPPLALLVRSGESTIRRVEDLEGKTVGIPALGSSEAHLFIGLLARHRLSPAQVRLVSLGDRGVAWSLERGEVAAGLLPEPWVSRLLAGGRFTPLVDLRGKSEAWKWLGGPTVHAGVFVRDDARPARELVPLVKALVLAVRSIHASNPESLAERLQAHLAGDREELILKLASLKGVLLADGLAAEGSIKNSLDLLGGAPPLPGSVKLPRRLSEILLLDPLRQALREVTGEK